MFNPYEQTPWRINLFRIEEFEKGLSISEQYEKLNPLRGWEGPNETSYLLSDSDMLISYQNAQELLKKDSLLEEFIDSSNQKGLNYLVKTTHNGPIQSCEYNGSVAIYNFISDISLALFNTSVAQESKDFRNQLYGYFENKENPSFNLVDGFGKELKK